MKREPTQLPPQATDEPFDRATMFRLVGPLIAVFLATLLATAAGGSASDPVAVLSAALLIVATAGVTAFAPWRRLPETMRALPAFSYLVAAFLISVATRGRLDFGEIALLPIVWLAVYGTLGELVALVVATALIELAPLMIPGQEDGGPTRLVFQIATAAILGFVVHQIVDQVRQQAGHLRSLARRDDLTAVANRRAWDEELTRAVRATKPEQPLAVAILDLDDFKGFNDRAGHQAGDRLLREIAAAWSSQLRRTDTLARIGGDEFAILLRDCPPDAAEDVMARLCASVPHGVTCSAGLASWDAGEPAQSLMARADAALYRAKAEGRGRVEVWHGSRRLVQPGEATVPGC
jgi:diguanylate cyclase (GGDEF)-like protein